MFLFDIVNPLTVKEAKGLSQKDMAKEDVATPHGPAASTAMNTSTRSNKWDTYNPFATMDVAFGDADDKRTLAKYQTEIMKTQFDHQTKLELTKKLGGVPPTSFDRNGTGIFAGMDANEFRAWLAQNPKYLDAILKISNPGTAPVQPTNPSAGMTNMSNRDPALSPSQQVAQNQQQQGLAEFARPPRDDDNHGEDPYKYPKPEHYSRSIDFFGQFEADHFDREDMDDATGVFKGYWGTTQIAYFKFDNPARTGSDDPGMGWYYEPQNEGVEQQGANPILDIATRASHDNGPLDGYVSSLYTYIERNNMENDPKWKQAEKIAKDYHFDWSKKNGYPSANTNPELARKGEKLRHRALVNAVVKVFGQQGVAEGVVDMLKGAWEKIKDFDEPGRYKGSNTSRREALRKKLELQKKQQKQQPGVAEDFSDSPVAGAITRRILQQRLDLLKQYGPDLVGAAVDNVADYVGDVDEIGSSDVSAWVAQVERMLKENPPEAFRETALNTKDPKGDYAAKRKALQDLSMNKDVDQQAVLQRRLDLDKEAKSKGVAEASDRVDPILIKALNRMPDGLTSHGQVLNAAYDAYAMELGRMEMKSQYGTTNAYIPQLMDLYKEKYGLDIKEAQTDYSKRRQRERDVDSGKTVARQPRNPQTDYARKRAQQKKETELGEMGRADVTGEEEPHGVFTVMINGKPWKTATSNDAFRMAKNVATKYPDKQVQVKWPNGALNTVKEDSSDFMANDSASPVGGKVTETPRMSAAVKLQRAFQREQEKSAASRKRGEEVMAQAKADFEKKSQDKQVNELSKDKLSNYVKANANDQVQHASSQSFISGKNGDKYNTADAWDKRTTNRERGMDRALNKLSRATESVDYLSKLKDERSRKLNGLVNELSESIKK